MHFGYRLKKGRISVLSFSVVLSTVCVVFISIPAQEGFLLKEQAEERRISEVSFNTGVFSQTCPRNGMAQKFTVYSLNTSVSGPCVLRLRGWSSAGHGEWLLFLLPSKAPVLHAMAKEPAWPYFPQYWEASWRRCQHFSPPMLPQCWDIWNVQLESIHSWMETKWLTQGISPQA